MPGTQSPTAPMSPVKPVGGVPGLKAPRGSYIQPQAPNLAARPATSTQPNPPQAQAAPPGPAQQLNVAGNPGWRTDIGSIAAQYASSPSQQQAMMARNAVVQPQQQQVRTASDQQLDRMLTQLYHMAQRPNPPVPLSIKQALRAYR